MNSIKKSKLFGCMVGAICLLLLCGCASIEEEAQMPQDSGEGSALVGAEQGMLSNYQGKVQSLEQQLTQMDQQMEALKEEYLQNAKKMQEELQLLREQAGKDTDTAAPGQEVGSHQPSEGTKPEYSTVDVPGEDGEKTSGTDYTYEQTEDGIVLKKYIGSDTTVVIPAAINGVRVVGMSDHVFSGTAVQSVVVPQTVKEMGWFVFYGCNQLKSVVLPASVERIGYAAFDGCHKDLILTVEADSYAQKYAASFAMRYQTP